MLEALILAGGRGTRLQPVIADRPKPMAPVCGRPFIEWLVRQLAAQGIRRVILSTGYQAESFERYLGSGARFGVELLYSREHAALGTGGAPRLALPLLQGTQLLVLNGDSYCRFDLARLQQTHAAARAAATIWLQRMATSDRYGAVRTDAQGAVTEFAEKRAGLGAGAISAGIYLIERSVLEAIAPDRAVSIEHELFPSLIGRGLYAVTGDGPFLDIGTPESYAAADASLASELAPLLPDWSPAAMQARAHTHLQESAAIYARLAEEAGDAIVQAVHLLMSCFQAGGKLLLCGNGGSAADAQHLAAEFTSRLTRDFERPALPAIALTTDTSFLTAYANDLDFDGVFARQVEALGRPGDLLIGFSTSGNSRNVLLAVAEAQRLGLKTLVFVGAGGNLAGIADATLAVPSHNTQYVQEATIALYHIVCDLVERALYG